MLALIPGDAGLAPHRYRWRVLENRGCAAAGAARTSLPAGGCRVFRLRPVRAVGCTGGGAGLVTNGPRDRKVVALTFDDGPSEYTTTSSTCCATSTSTRTFFEIGQEMPGREDTMRRILREGSEIGNHTIHHATFPGYCGPRRDQRADRGGHPLRALPLPPARRRRQLRRHRPPRPSLGHEDGHLGRRPRATGPTPAAAPSTAASSAPCEPGSIVIMHDGGGDRSDTLAALPAIIDTLRGRGYRFATVSELLGNRLIYRPYG